MLRQLFTADQGHMNISASDLRGLCWQSEGEEGRRGDREEGEEVVREEIVFLEANRITPLASLHQRVFLKQLHVSSFPFTEVGDQVETARRLLSRERLVII